jgi:hypothetical protein
LASLEHATKLAVKPRTIKSATEFLMSVVLRGCGDVVRDAAWSE